VTTPRIACLILAFCFLLSGADPAGGQLQREPFVPRPGDEGIYKRISQVRQAADNVKVDGRADDWQKIPEFTDPPNDAVVSDGSRDIVRAAIAPREEDLLVVIETAQRPSTEDLAFWFDVDLLGFQAADFQIGLSAMGEHTLWVFEEGRPAVQKSLKGLEVSIREVVEVRVPYKVLIAALPAAMGAQLAAERARPVIRVSPFTWDKRSRRFLDYGPAVACFRLAQAPFPLDPPPARGLKALRAIDLPVAGKWYVGQGAFGPSTHQDVFAYDFYMLDSTGHPSTVRESRRNEDYLSWNQSVIAPLNGRVLRFKKDAADNPPRSADFEKKTDVPVNEVFLDVGDGMGLSLAHFRRQTVNLAQGQAVSAGRVVGNVGNSGKSAWPHLHVGLWRLPEAKVTLPLALANVRVSLNLPGEDPWGRDFTTWDIREGYFVERLRR